MPLNPVVRAARGTYAATLRRWVRRQPHNPLAFLLALSGGAGAGNPRPPATRDADPTEVTAEAEHAVPAGTVV